MLKYTIYTVLYCSVKNVQYSSPGKPSFSWTSVNGQKYTVPDCDEHNLGYQI